MSTAAAPVATTLAPWQAPSLADALELACDLARVVDQVRSPADLFPALTEAVTLAARGLGYRAASVNLYRPATDDYQTAIISGSDEQTETLLGSVIPASSVRGLLQARVAHHGSHFIPYGAYDWDGWEAPMTTPDMETSEDPTRWHPEDALVVPLRDGAGTPLGLMWFDEPADGLRPTEARLELAAVVGRHAAYVVVASASALAEAEHNHTLGELVATSLHLHDGDLTEVLDTLSGAVRDSLGFRRVAIALRGRGAGAPSSRVGWPAGADAWDGWPAAETVLGLLDPASERDGCHLLGAEEAEARLGVPVPAALQTGCVPGGPRAWQRHWLLVPLRDADGAPLGYVLADDPADGLLPDPDRLGALRLFADQAATAIAAAGRRDELARLARHDALTSLPNRLAFDERLGEALGAGAGAGEPLSLVLCDLDAFKAINDRHGHAAGDDALCRAAGALARSIRAEDRVYRLGGDEFAVVVAGGGRAARRVAHAVRTAVRAVGLSASLGVATRAPGDTAERLAARADRGLYRDKRARR